MSECHHQKALLKHAEALTRRIPLIHTIAEAQLLKPYPRFQNVSLGVVEAPKKPQCWDHGCNGRQFSTFSNLLRHQREKSGTSQKSVCHRCGAEFTRKTARDGHLAHDKCKPRSSSDRESCVEIAF